LSAFFSDFFFFACCLYSIAEGAENNLEFTIVRPFNWIGPRMDFIPGIDGPSEGVPRVLACFSNVCIISFIISHWNMYITTQTSSIISIPLQNLLRREPLKLVDGGVSQRTFIYIKDAIEAVLLMIENPSRANGHIFNVGNPNNEVSVRQLAEIMTQVCRHEFFFNEKIYMVSLDLVWNQHM
jgi:UDP-apiose/xylose synthase